MDGIKEKLKKKTVLPPITSLLKIILIRGYYKTGADCKWISDEEGLRSMS